MAFTCGLAPDAFGPEERDADVMLAMDVMEHVPDDYLFASSLLGALKPGGHLLITVPADAALWSAHDEAFGHYRRYSRPRLERVWRDLPVTPLLVSHAMARLYPLVRAVRGWNRLRGRAAGQAGTDFTLAGPINAALERLLAGESPRLVAAMRDLRAMLIEAIVKSAAASDYGLRSLVHAVVESDAFRSK